MAQRFFELYDDVYVPRRWHLDNPIDSQGRELEDWQFRMGERVHIKEHLKIPIEHEGRALDFTMTSLSIPVVHVRVANVFQELAAKDVQLIPVDIPGHPEQYLILVATRLIKCIDEKASRVQFWQPEDGLPDKVGTYYAVDDLHIDKSRVGEAKVFRLDGLPGTLIVSGDIKDALERIGATGPKFTEV